MLPSPFLCLTMEPLDVGLELLAVDAPEAAAPDLDARQLAGSDERIHLRDRNVEVRGHVFERQETRLDSALAGGVVIERGIHDGGQFFAHTPTIAPRACRQVDSLPVALI